jgi:hypothetical protein
LVNLYNNAYFQVDGATVKKNAPTQILSQFTGSKMGLGRTKSPASQSTRNKNIGANIDSIVKGMVNPAARNAIKNKINLKRKR